MNTPPKIENAPGLVWRPHKTGWVARWQCRTDLARRGFPRKSERLWFGAEPEEDDIAWIQSRCNALQAEMVVWGRGGIPRVGEFDGTVRSLCRCYQTDKDSPFRKLRYQTRVYYDNMCRRIEAEFGDRRIADIKAREVLHWNERLADSGKVSMAHSLVGMLRHVNGRRLENRMHPMAEPWTKWNPIETAPKDGEWILLWAGGDYIIGHFEMSKEWPNSPTGFNDWSAGLETAGQYDCGFKRIYRPTHWMPLPNPPIVSD